MKKLSKTTLNILHILLGLVALGLGIWLQGFNYKGFSLGLLFAFLFGLAKEMNDKYGWVPFLLTDGKTKTGLNTTDIAWTVSGAFVANVIFHLFFV